MAMVSKINEWLDPLAEGIRKTPDFLYYGMLLAYLIGMLVLRICFDLTPELTNFPLKAKFINVFLLFLGLFLISVFLRCIRKIWAILPVFTAVVLFLFWFSGLQEKKFDGAAIAFLAIGAYGRDYRKILKLFLWCMAATVIIAAIGIPAGFTKMVSKVGPYGTGPGFGLVHPNMWSILVMTIFFLVWYFFDKGRMSMIRVMFYVLSWALGIMIVFVPKCRTAALLLFLLALISVLCGNLDSGHGTGKRQKNRIITGGLIWMLILMPFLCFFITLFLGTQREWLVIHTFGTYFENLSKRFVQSGLAFKEHGLPLIGELIRFRAGPGEQLGAYRFWLYILDNGYAKFAILRGMIWMVPALLWLSFANWKMVRRRDWNLLVISVLFCLMALMEWCSFEIYNFVFLYPLASAAGSGKTARGAG